MLLFAILSALATVAVAGVPQPRGVLIVGGKDTTIEKHPHQVSLERPYDPAPLWHWCGGSIVTPKFIVTAAACVIDSENVEMWNVRLGSTTSNEGGISIKLAAIQYNPDFSMSILDGDVAVVTLKEAVTYSDKIQPITLVPINKEPQAGERLVATGWGKMSGGQMATVLQEVEVPVVDKEECRGAYGGAVTDTMLCAGVAKKDSCHGDAGGPLINAQRQLVGIISWGFGCGKQGFPGVYASIANQFVHNFITNITNVTEKGKQ